MTICEVTRTRCYVIAELGQSHNGSMATARALIDAASAAGADAVKSQKRDVAVPPASWDREYSGSNSFGRTYAEHRRALELTVEQHADLSKYARSRGMEYSCSAWDKVSLDAIDSLDPPWHKVASALGTDQSMLTWVAEKRRPTLLSTGGTDQAAVSDAIEILKMRRRTAIVPWLGVLETTMTYPNENADVGLDVLRAWLWSSTPLPFADVCGLSGHHRGIQMDVAAVALGARVIERHLTLDRTMKGTDHAASLEPGGFAKLVRDIRAVESALRGDGIKRVRDCEQAAIAKLRG